MRIDGQLIRAQLEVVAGAVASLIVGRIWYDKTAERTKVVNSSGTAKVLVSEDDTQTLTNKTLSGNTAVTLISGSGTLTLPTSGNATVPNATDTLVGKATTDTLTNKTIDAEGTGNSISNIKNSNIKAAAAIAVNKLAALATDRALVSDVLGFVSAHGTTTATEIGYLAGVTSAVQDQIDSISAGTNNASNMFENLGLASSVAADAITIVLKQADGSNNPSTGSDRVRIAMRDATSAIGGYNIRSVESSLSIVVSSGSTLGSTSGNANWIYVYAIDNAGTIELAVSGTSMGDEGTVITTTAEGGAGAADSKTTLYSTTQRTSVPFRLIGRVKSTQATAGTWATSPSEVSIAPFRSVPSINQISLVVANGHGSTNTKIRRFTTIDKNIGSAMTLAQSSTNGDSVTINEDGFYSINYYDTFNAASGIGVTLNSGSLTTNVASVTANTKLCFSESGAADAGTGCSWAGPLYAGDVVRAHTNGATVGANAEKVRFQIMKIN